LAVEISAAPKPEVIFTLPNGSPASDDPRFVFNI
jgi:hypothetical protein